MAFVDPAFEQRRAQILGKTPGGSTTTSTQSGSSFSDPVFEQRRKQILSQPRATTQPAKKVSTTPIQVNKPVLQQIGQRVASNAQFVGQQVGENIGKPLISTAKKIGELSVKIVSPQQAKIQAETKNLPQTPIKITEKQKKLTTGQLQQVSDSSSTMKRQSPQESINRAEEIRRMTSGKIKALEQTFNSKVVKPREVKKGYKEPGIIGGMIEEITLGTISTLGNIGAGIEMEGRKINEKSLDGKDMVTKFLLTNVGRKISAEADNIIASNPEWMSDPKEGWSARKIARLGAGAAPSILINIAATIATLPAGGIGGYATGYLMEGGATYKEAKKMGVDEKKAQFYGTTVGVVNSIFEHIMPGSLSFGKKISKEVLKESAGEVSKSLAKDALKKLGKFGLSLAKNGALEGSTEGIQELWSNIIATNYDKNRKPWDNIIESVVGGFIGGGVAGGGPEQAVQQTGLIPDGTYTPEQMIGKIVSSKLSNTKEGNELVKTALQAQEAGQSVEIQNTVNSKPETVNQTEYKSGSIPEIQRQMDEILGVDTNIKNINKKQGIWGKSYLALQQKADSGDAQAIADIDKIVALQRKIEDLRDQRQKTTKSKKVNKSAREYVETKVKERTTKFRMTQDEKANLNEESGILMHLLEKDEVSNKLYDSQKNPEVIDDFADMEYITRKIMTEKATMEDINAGFAILEKNGYSPELIKTILTADDYKINKANKSAQDYIQQKQPKFRDATSKTPTLEEIKAKNAKDKETIDKSGQKSAENIGEEKMGWKDGQKDEFDNALDMKNAEKVRKMLPEVPGYYKEEFKNKINEVVGAVENETDQSKFRVKDDVKRMTGKTITDAQEQELIDLNKKIFGDENVNITLQIMANSKALGQYEQNMIDILDGQADPKATYLHEAVHKYLDVFSTSDEYTQVLEEGAVKYKTEDFAEVEEKIAEDFITYAKNKESAQKTITGKIK